MLKLLSNRLFLAPIVFVLISITMNLSSCARKMRSPDMSKQPSLPYKVDGAYDKAAKKMQNNFNKHGIRVINLGQNYLVSIPSNAIFYNNSPRIKWRSYGLLNDMACYLRQFRKIDVNVSSYVGKCISPRRDRALTLARSRAVSDYLWSQNIESQLAFTYGLGSDKPIVKFDKGGDTSPNSRVEITFRDVVA